MKIWMLNLWAWVVAHPAETLGALYAALNAINAAIPVERRKSSRLARVLDALCIVTQRGAENATSWPVVGRSIARDLVTLSIAPPKPEDKKSEPGFSEAALLRWVAGAASLALVVYALTACRMPEPDGCSPFATRCSPSGIPEVCSQSRRWSYAPPSTPCSSRGPVVCCWTRSPWGRELHACVPESACLPVSSDAGVEVSDGQ